MKHKIISDVKRGPHRGASLLVYVKERLALWVAGRITAYNLAQAEIWRKNAETDENTLNAEMAKTSIPFSYLTSLAEDAAANYSGAAEYYLIAESKDNALLMFDKAADLFEEAAIQAMLGEDFDGAIKLYAHSADHLIKIAKLSQVTDDIEKTRKYSKLAVEAYIHLAKMCYKKSDEDATIDQIFSVKKYVDLGNEYSERAKKVLEEFGGL